MAHVVSHLRPTLLEFSLWKFILLRKTAILDTYCAYVTKVQFNAAGHDVLLRSQYNLTIASTAVKTIGNSEKAHSCAFSVYAGIIYLPGPSPAKYFRRERA